MRREGIIVIIVSCEEDCLCSREKGGEEYRKVK